MTDLKIYWSNLTPTRNAWVDDIEDYLSGLQVFYRCEDFQYQRFANELEIVIPVPQADLSQQEVGNYVRIYQDNIAWYYFVMSYKWTSKSSLRLELSIDSVNTFVGSHIHFSPKTVIEREHRDRYIRDEDNNKKLIKQFDPENEEVPVTQERTRNVIVSQNNNNNLDWFLIYKTNKDASVQEDNPISCYCIAQNPLVISKTGGGASQTLYPTDLPDGQYNYVLGADNPDFSFTYTYDRVLLSGADRPAHSTQTVTITEGGEFMIPEYVHSTIGGVSTIVKATEKIYRVDNLIFVSDGADYIYVMVAGTYLRDGTVHNGNPALGTWTPTFSGYIAQSAGSYESGTTLKINELNFTRVTYDGNIAIEYAQQLISTTQTYNIGTQVTRSTIGYSSVDKTDTKIIKIIRLPYAPCEVEYDSDTGVYTFPEEWEYNGGYMQLNDASLSTEFESSLDDVDWSFLVQNLGTAPSFNDNRIKTKNDPKIETSQFSTYKFLYDSFAQEVKLERFNLTDATQNPTLPIKFKPTNTINSRFAFKFNWELTAWGSDANIKYGSDYDEYLLVSRNNEETIFSSDYLNYLRNGYNYDKKVKSEQSAMSYLMGGLQVAGAVVGFAASAFTGGASAAAGVALATGAITTFASAGYQQYSNEQAMAQKLKNLQMQAASVSGSDDVDLLKYYNKNKLYFVSYAPLQFQRNALNDLFHYCGYKHKAMGVPNTESRVWFNFIQCKPVFEEEESGEVGAPYNKFWDDIKTRFMAGVTRYHHVNGSYDWAQSKENWEVALVRGELQTTVTVVPQEMWDEYNTEGYVVNNRYGDTIDIELYWDEGSWEDKDPDETSSVQVNADGSFSDRSIMQDGIAIRMRLHNTSTGDVYPWVIVWEAE